MESQLQLLKLAPTTPQTPVPQHPHAFLKLFASHVAPAPCATPSLSPGRNRLSTRLSVPKSDGTSGSPQNSTTETEGGPPRRIIPTVVSSTPSPHRPAAFASGPVAIPKNVSSPLTQHSHSKPPNPASVKLSNEYDVNQLAMRHSTALSLVWRDAATPPSVFLKGVSALLVALSRKPASSPTSDYSSPASPFPATGSSALCMYARTVLQNISSILAVFPQSLGDIFNRLSLTTRTIQSQTSFPTGSFTPLHPTLDLPPLLPADTDAAPGIPRLRSNLEVVWDKFLALHRKFRGDIATKQAGTLDQLEALHAIAALHPANADAFAARFVSFTTRCTRTPPNAPDRMRRLDERIYGGRGSKTSRGSVSHHVPDMTSQRGNSGSTNNGLSNSRGRVVPSRKPTSGVVLHRAPQLVRDAFALEHPGQVFFLDFVITVDSARLNAALTVRLASGVSQAVGAAACATTSSTFTDAVIEGRLFAKLLSAVMHGANWPHSAAALSGAAPPTAAAAAATLPPAVSALRACPWEAIWTAIFNISRLVDDAMASKETLSVVAAAAVADVVIRFAAVDPIARETQWYRCAVTSMAGVAVVDENNVIVPIVRVLVGDLLATPGVLPDGGLPGTTGINPVVCPSDTAVLIGDPRFLRAVVPALDELRQECVAAERGHIDMPRIVTRRITPLPANVELTNRFTPDSQTSGSEITAQKDTSILQSQKSTYPASGTNDECNHDSEMDDIQSKLQREYFARVDGRIRELVSVVASASVENSLPAAESLIKVVQMLYPSTPPTVAAVAGAICAKRVKTSIREVNGNNDVIERNAYHSRNLPELELHLTDSSLANNNLRNTKS